eukprot:Opistho-2@74590
MSAAAGGGAITPSSLGDKSVGDRDLAAKAKERFDARDFDGSIQILRQLLKAREGDAKVAHNIAVVEYYKSQCSATEEFLASLAKISWNGSMEGESNGDVGGDEIESSVAMYNQAVILIQTRQHLGAIAILEQLYRRIEPIEETLARKICFVLLDLYLSRGDADKAGFVMAYLEKTLNAAAAAAGGKGGAQSASAETGGQTQTAKDGSSKESKEQSDASVRQMKLQLHVYKARFHLLTRSIKACKREIKSALNASSQNPTALFLKSNFEYCRQNYRKSVKLLNSCVPRASDPQQQQPSPAVAAQLQRDWHAVAAMYFNDLGAVHHQMRRHAMASYYFGRALKENLLVYQGSAVSTDGQRRNLSTLARDRRYELHVNSGVQRLLTGDAHGAYASLHASLPVFSGNPRVWLRIGEACIAVYVDESSCQKRAVVAGEAASQGTGSSLALDARLYAVAGEEGRRVIAASALAFDANAGAGDRTSSEAAADGSSSTYVNGTAQAGGSAGVAPTPSLLYAEWCLLTGLAVLAHHCNAPKQSASQQLQSVSGSGQQQQGEKETGAHGAQNGSTHTGNGHVGTNTPHAPATPTPAFEPPITCPGQCGSGGMVRPGEFVSLRCALLTALSFVQLSLEDYGAALVSANAVTAEDGCPGQLGFLSKLYAAEALVQLGRVQEAAARLEQLRPEDADSMLDHLRQEQMQQQTATADSVSRSHTVVWRDDALLTVRPRTQLPTAGVALLVNLAAAMAAKGDLDQARACIRRVAVTCEAVGAPVPPHAIVMSAYIDIRRGDRVGALESIRNYRLSSSGASAQAPPPTATTTTATTAPAAAAHVTTSASVVSGGASHAARGGNGRGNTR